ncbi:type II toxin-antitoxin system VapC family toxin [Pseudokineococcus basanitobsidens]|uniref:Ribonuclease VapC n=1 Tax=Pseudokineococcus basanitobsidens TaxID=1926649 RepID=A0ABU8RHG2_9ACTN
MIVDASVVIDAVADPGPRGAAARAALARQPAAEQMSSPGHLAFEVLSGLRAAANRPSHPFQPDDVAQALHDAEGFGITIHATPWGDVRRAWHLSKGSLRYADGLYVAAAKRLGTTLMTADTRIERSGAPIACSLLTVTPGPGAP